MNLIKNILVGGYATGGAHVSHQLLNSLVCFQSGMIFSCLKLYWLVLCICQINLLDTLFCSWLIYGCEQLRHLKESMHLMMQLSASEGVSTLSAENGKVEFIVENEGAICFL